jgi:hypothetical protein
MGSLAATVPQEQQRQTQEQARKDVLEAMQKAGFDKQAIERGKEILEQVFREQRERQERAEPERLDRLA